MRYSTRLADTIHVLVLISENQNSDLSSTAIANSVKSNPSYIRKIMANLKKGGLIFTKPGSAKPVLAKSPDEITMFDLYRIVEGDTPLLHMDTHTNPECGIGIQIQNAIQDVYQDIQKTAENRMKAVTLKDLIHLFYAKTQLSEDHSSFPS